MGIFAQVWFWSALAFLAGALLSWALLALPARRQLAQQDGVDYDEDEALALPPRRTVPPLPERPSFYDGDPVDRRPPSPFDDEPLDRRPPSPFDDEPLERRRPSPFDDEPLERRRPSPFDDEPAPPVLANDANDANDEEYDRFSSPLRRMDREPAARTELLSGVDTPDGPSADDAVDRGVLRLSGPSVSGPTVQVPVAGSLDPNGLFAPPEPPIPGGGAPEEAAEATRYLPAIAPPEPAREVGAPAEVDEVGNRDWFQDNRGRSAVTDAESDKQTDSGDLEADADTGTIFTQRTQPVPGELISRLDESTSDTTEESTSDEEAPASASQPTSVLPVRKPGATRFDTGSRPLPPKPEPEPKPEIEPTQALATPEPTQAVEPEGTRSLFEPIVPADESATRAMPSPGAADATKRTSDGAFVPPGPFGPGSAMPLPGGAAPSAEFTIKASVTALRYCEPDSPLFGRTVAEVWFRTTKDAERVGFRPLS